MERQVSEDDLAEETRERLAQYADVFGQIAPEARRVVAEALRDRPIRHAQPRQYQELLGRAVARLLREDADFLRGYELFEEVAKQALTVTPPRDVPETVRDLRFPLGRARAGALASRFPDWHVSFLRPPYLNEWVAMTGDQSHQEQIADAFDSTAVFRFITNIGDEGGSAETHVGVLAGYAPTGRYPTMQILPTIPFQYIYRDISYAGTAHNDAGFGILVHSWDPASGRNTTESDTSYSIWSDGTSWAEDHSNPSYSSWDTAQAFSDGLATPISVKPNVIYSFAFYCWGSCDADGKSIWGSSYAMQAINATLQSVAVFES